MAEEFIVKIVVLLRSAACIAVWLIVLSPLSSFAEGTAQQRAACMGDAFRFCAADIPDAGRIETCLIQHMSRLAPACQAQFEPQMAVRAPAASVRAGESR
jgi:hypothetical protein